MTRNISGEVDTLLKKWEESYKKGLLSFWLLLILYGQPSYAYELGGMVSELSLGTVTADEKSIYRALVRFQAMGLVESELLQSKIGPQRRYYSLTQKGTALLMQFICRNILVFNSPTIKDRIHMVLKNEISFNLSEVDDAVSQTTDLSQIVRKGVAT